MKRVILALVVVFAFIGAQAEAHKGVLRTVANISPKQIVVTSAKAASYPLRHPKKFAHKTKAIAY